MNEHNEKGTSAIANKILETSVGCHFRSIAGWLRIVSFVYPQEVVAEIEERIEEKERIMKRIEKQYYQEEYPKVLESVRAFKEEMKNNSELKQARLDFLQGEVQELEKAKDSLGHSINEDFLQGHNSWIRFIYNAELREVKKTLNRATFEINMLTGKLSEFAVSHKITEVMIQKAREYPIESLIKVNGTGFALCPYHDDKNPSFYVKNNFAYCFACQVSKDPIALAMDLFDLNFLEAVKKLQN